MQDPLFYPKSFHIEFKPKTSCPTAPARENGTVTPSKKSKLWTKISHECPVEDSACLEATIEVITTFNGARNSLELDPYSTMSSKGYIRACASRKYLKSRTEPTITYKDEAISNNTVSDIVTRLRPQDKSGYFIKRIHMHEFYIDHGTEDSVTCYQDNCNDSTRRNSRNGAVGNVESTFINLNLFCVLMSVLLFNFKSLV